MRIDEIENMDCDKACIKKAKHMAMATIMHAYEMHERDEALSDTEIDKVKDAVCILHEIKEMEK